jgi:hypothetical protein
MQWFWRPSALPVGLVVIVLGVGNWSSGQPKVAARAAPAPDPIDTRDSFEDFQRLTARTNGGVSKASTAAPATIATPTRSATSTPSSTAAAVHRAGRRAARRHRHDPAWRHRGRVAPARHRKLG